MSDTASSVQEQLEALWRAIAELQDRLAEAEARLPKNQ